MIRSDSLDALSAALSAAQGEFEAVAKTENNTFFKSSYSPLPEVVKAATPILTKHGLAVWQGADTDETGELLWTVVLHESGQFIGSSARLLPVKDDPQAQGSAITYQRRYQYMSALGLVADDDDDGNAASQPSRPSKPVSRSQPPKRPVAPRVTPAAPTVAKDASEPPQDANVVEIVNDLSIEALGKAIRASGKTDTDVAWCLLSVGVESLPENPSRDDLKVALSGLTVDQALRFDSLVSGDDAVPGSGESS